MDKVRPRTKRDEVQRRSAPVLRVVVLTIGPRWQPVTHLSQPVTGYDSFPQHQETTSRDANFDDARG